MPFDYQQDLNGRIAPEPRIASAIRLTQAAVTS